MQVSRMLWRKDSTLRQLMMQNMTTWKVHVESTHNLEVINHRTVKGWIRGNTKIGPVLDVAVGCRQCRYGVEIMINSLFGGGTRSWVRIVNGKNKYGTEMSEETRIEDIGESTGKPVAKARPRSDTKFDVIFYHDSSAVSRAEMDRLWTRKIRQKLSGSIEIDDQIAATWWHSTSR